MAYNWELPDWPNFTFSTDTLQTDLYKFAMEVGEISGLLKALPDETQYESYVEVMLAEAIKNSEIEGEFLSRQDVMSSIRNNLGLNTIPEPVREKRSQGMGELMVDLRNTYSSALTKEQLWKWHRMLMAGSVSVRTGQWRMGDKPMQVISGSIGRERVHFQAPPSERVAEEMQQFVDWFNNTAPSGSEPIVSAPVRAAIAHLYFESIHPFEDGNGRIGRTIAEKALSQTVGRPLLISLSRTIEAGKKHYYAALESAQKTNEISGWINYFVQLVLDAQAESKTMIEFTFRKTVFFDTYSGRLNERQIKAVRRMFDAGPDGFEGGMSAKKYMSITHASKATATRDLQNLVDMGALETEGGGRSVRYSLRAGGERSGRSGDR